MRKDFHRHFHLEGRRWRGWTGQQDFDLAIELHWLTTLYCDTDDWDMNECETNGSTE